MLESWHQYSPRISRQSINKDRGSVMLKDIIGFVKVEEIKEEIGNIVESLKILGYKNVKPWGEFFAGIKPPKQWDLKHLEQRMMTNFLHFRSNYLVVCGVVVALRIVLAPFTLLSLFLVLAWWIYLMLIVKGPFKVGDFLVDEQKKMIICAVSSAVFLALTGVFESLIWCTLICLVLCGVHMLLRSRSMSSNTNRMYEEVKLNMFTSPAGTTTHHGRRAERTSPGGDGDDGRDVEDPKQSPQNEEHANLPRGATAGAPTDMRKRTSGTGVAAAPGLVRPLSKKD